METVLLVALVVVIGARVLGRLALSRRDPRQAGEFSVWTDIVLRALTAVVFGWIAAHALEEPTAFRVTVAAIFVLLGFFEVVMVTGMLYVLLARPEEPDEQKSGESRAKGR